MKPTAPLRNKFSVFATTPCRGLSHPRRRKRAIAVAVAFLTAGCANDFRHGAGFPISSERAVQIVSDELRRRGIAISPLWRVDVTDDVVITEAVGDIPTWLVTFHAP